MLFISLLCYSYFFCYIFTWFSLTLSSSKVISSSKPMLTYSISCLGLAFIFFSSSLISNINSFFFYISTLSYYFFFSSTLRRSYFSSSAVFLFFSTTFSRSTSMFSLPSCTYSMTFFLFAIIYYSSFYLYLLSSWAISLISSTRFLFYSTFSSYALIAASLASSIYIFLLCCA